MSSRNHRLLLSRWVTTIAASLLLISPTFADNFRYESYSTFINADASAGFVNATFGSVGLHSIGGGVVLQGLAQFFLEEGQNQHPVPSSEIALSLDEKKNVSLVHRGVRYNLGSHRGIACPLGQFISRDGHIAYTIPPAPFAGNADDQRKRLEEAGLVTKNLGTFFGEGVAKEFYKTNFQPLVEGADFADTEPLPRELALRIMQNINGALGTNRTEVAGGSYINTDGQVTYRVFLHVGLGRVDISGLPLRYYWDYAANGSAIVKDVQIFSHDWPQSAIATDVSVPNKKIRPFDFNQYDYVIFYQTAAIFRKMHLENKTAFQEFVSAACSR